MRNLTFFELISVAGGGQRNKSIGDVSPRKSFFQIIGDFFEDSNKGKTSFGHTPERSREIAELDEYLTRVYKD